MANKKRSVNRKSASASTADQAPRVIRHLTLQERTKLGKEARTRCPRSDHAAWDPPKNRPDPVDLLEAQAATRIPELIPIRYGRMSASPFAFYRGAAAIMAWDLAHTPSSGIEAQLCGDAHLSNFGGFASPERDLVFDISDFDETLRGPWEWDVKRLAASVEIVGRERDFAVKLRRLMLLATVGEYRRAMREFAVMHNLDVWYALLDAPKIKARWGAIANPKEVKQVAADFTQPHLRDNVRALEKLTHRVDGQLRIVSHPPLIVPFEELYPENADRTQAEDYFRAYLRAYRQTLPDNRRHLLEQFHFAHLARKVVGVGSVGTRAYVALLLGRDDEDALFLQFKEAEASVLEPYLGKSKFADHGRRVVEGQRLMQAASDIFLGWEKVPLGVDGKSHDYYARQLWDWKISADIETMPPKELLLYGKMCGWTLARAHARSGDRIAIGSYLGKNDSFDQAIAEFVVAYADQNERDYQALKKAIKTKRIKAQPGV